MISQLNRHSKVIEILFYKLYGFLKPLIFVGFIKDEILEKN